MKIQEYKKKTFNYFHILLLSSLYFFGFYGIGSIEPTWKNLDGLIYFWIYQATVLISIILIFTVLYKTSKTELNNKNFTIAINLNHTLIFVFFFCFLLAVNYGSISNDLAEDETSYAGYSVHHVDKILYDLNPSILSDVKTATLYRVGLLIFLLVAIFLTKLLGLFSWKKTLVLCLFTLLVLRAINQFYFKLNVYSLPYTEPLFFIHQMGIIIFGYTSTGFRLSTIAIFALFMLSLKILLEKYYFFSNFKSIVTTLAIVSLPVVLSMSTRIDHGQFSYFSQVLMWIYILSPSRIPTRCIAPFLVISIYFSLTSINILIAIFLYFLSSHAKRNQLIFHLKDEWRTYVFLAPIILITTLKAIKDWHLKPLATGYSFISYDERMWALIKTLPNAIGSIYVLVIACLTLYSIYRKTLSLLFFVIYASVTLFMYTFFVVTTALDHNRYSFQLIASLLVIIVIHFMKSDKNFMGIRTRIFVFSVICNLVVFMSFQRNYNNFDRYVKENTWNYSINNVRQPFNVIWPSTAYSDAIRAEHNSDEGGRFCVLLGLYYKAVPYALSGSDLSYLRATEKILSLPMHRIYLDGFNQFKPGDSWFFHSEVRCVIVSSRYYKQEFVDYLLTQKWIVKSSYPSNNGIQVLVLERE